MASHAPFTPPAPPGAGGSLPADVTILFMLLNEIRHRAVTRVFGVSRRDSNVLTGVAVVLAAAGLQGGAARVRAVRKHPSGAEATLGAVALKETAHGLAGEWSRGVPSFGALIAFALLAKSLGPTVRSTWHDMQASLHGVRATWRSLRSLVAGS
jgi:hypothetical protein